ncbi:MAG: tRNA 2-thiouridine(34) synthase MnmA [Alphaproteobacteria bacterium]|nr:tRNA 2-thiouridine(34) synthase MnmA [Alphaproteobacteria bacterium]
MTQRIRCAVALSGGVDSAVVAALLREEDAEVVALTLRLQPGDDFTAAAQVAAHLGLEHHIVDAVAAFREQVMMPFAQSYRAGETPLPCALCNRFIKFGVLIEAAQAHGAQALATGHYARRVVGLEGVAELHKGRDITKDQSYFLFALRQAQIDFLRFPLGEMTKDHVRELARRHGLPVAERKGSQDICFVPQGDYASVVAKLSPLADQAGDIVDQAGRVLGRHGGIIHYTVGQRKGLNLSARIGDANEPLYVLSVNAVARQVVVGPREALERREVVLRDVNWLGGFVPGEGFCVQARLRSAQQPALGRFFAEGEGGRLVFEEPVSGVAKGQAGVIYQGDRLLGGGWIT